MPRLRTFAVLLAVPVLLAQWWPGVASQGFEYVLGVPWSPLDDYVAENFGSPRQTEWAAVRWVNGSAAGVSFSFPEWESEAAEESIGALANITFAEGTPMTNCKLDPRGGQLLICLSRTIPFQVANWGGRGPSCCGDHFEVYYKDGRSPQNLEFLFEVMSGLDGDWGLDSGGTFSTIEAGTILASQGFILEREDDGKLTMLLSLEYFNDELLAAGATDVDDHAFVRLSLMEDSAGYITGVKIIPTVWGPYAIKGYRDYGTRSPSPEDGIHKLHYANRILEDSGPPSSTRPGETPDGRNLAQVTGLTRFRDPATGMHLIAFSLIANSEVVIITDPWRMPSRPSIVQRFGTPPVRDTDTGFAKGLYYFGVTPDTTAADPVFPSPGLAGGCHAPWFTSYTVGPAGTITALFNMNMDGVDGNFIGTPGINLSWNNSRVYEFAINPVMPNAPIEADGTGSRAAFPAPYQMAELDVPISTGGGARPLQSGLYLVSIGFQGAAVPDYYEGLAALDTDGNINRFNLTAKGWGEKSWHGWYDPFNSVRPEAFGTDTS